MGNSNKKQQKKIQIIDPDMLSKAIVGGGCFWCTQTIFQRLRGVHKVQSGYAGGHVINPTYQQICGGNTGHAQVIRIFYDSKIISYRNLLYIFLHIHDPTTLNRQGHDSGTQYRSTIMYETEEQKKAAEEAIQQATKQGKYPGAPDKIVTEITKLKQFYVAEQYHQNYYNLNTQQGYCNAIIKPKLSKFKKLFDQYIDKSKL